MSSDISIPTEDSNISSDEYHSSDEHEVNDELNEKSDKTNEHEKSSLRRTFYLVLFTVVFVFMIVLVITVVLTILIYYTLSELQPKETSEKSSEDVKFHTYDISHKKKGKKVFQGLDKLQTPSIQYLHDTKLSYIINREEFNHEELGEEFFPSKWEDDQGMKHVFLVFMDLYCCLKPEFEYLDPNYRRSFQREVDYIDCRKMIVDVMMMIEGESEEYIRTLLREHGSEMAYSTDREEQYCYRQETLEQEIMLLESIYIPDYECYGLCRPISFSEFIENNSQQDQDVVNEMRKYLSIDPVTNKTRRVSRDQAIEELKPLFEKASQKCKEMYLHGVYVPLQPPTDINKEYVNEILTEYCEQEHKDVKFGGKEFSFFCTADEVNNDCKYVTGILDEGSEYYEYGNEIDEMLDD